MSKQTNAAEPLQPGDVVPYRTYLREHFPGISDITSWRWVSDAGIKRFRGPGRKVYASRADLDQMIRDKVANGEA